MVVFQMDISVNFTSCAIIMLAMMMFLVISVVPSSQGQNYTRQKRSGTDDDDDEGKNLNFRTRLTVYSWADYEGWLIDIDDLEKRDHVHTDFVDTNERTTSFERHEGSCVEFHRNRIPTYAPNEWMWTAKKSMPKLPRPFAGSVIAVKKCGRYHRNMFCPEGTFLRTVTMTRKNKLKDGIILHCHHPSSVDADERIRSHGGEDEHEKLADKTTCTSVRGIWIKEDANKQATIDLGALCSGETAENAQLCDNQQRHSMTGIHLDIEHYTGYIKHFKIFCDDIGRIEYGCIPYDKKTSVFTCDASSALHPFTCRHPKSVGIGYKDHPTDEDSEERNFYEDHDFSLDNAGSLLEQNFRDNLGKSSETDYDWQQAHWSSFANETTITVEVEAAPGCVTEVVEIVGECSFIRASPYYFQRTDHCGTKSFSTDEEIPPSLVEESRRHATGRKLLDAVFVSNIPDEVAQYLKVNK